MACMWLEEKETRRSHSASHTSALCGCCSTARMTATSMQSESHKRRRGVRATRGWGGGGGGRKSLHAELLQVSGAAAAFHDADNEQGEAVRREGSGCFRL